MSKPTISIIFSFYNEQLNIEKSVNEVSLVLKKIKRINFELIYVNDCSTDESLNVLEKLSSKNKKIKVINLSRRFGHMPGIMAGLKNCNGDAAIYLDIDLQDPPELMDKMINCWIDEGVDVVFTTRNSRKESYFMRFITSIGYYILKKTTYIDMNSNSGDYRLISRRVINEYVEFRELNPFFRFIVDFIGFKKKQIFYDRNIREFGKSNFKLYKIFHQFFEISLTPFSDFPIRFSLLFGIISFIICTVILTRTGYLFLSGNDDISSTSILGAILFFGSFQSIILGILAIYIGSIFKETKKRPLYIIDNKINFK